MQEVYFYNIRSHCDHGNHKVDNVFKSELISKADGTPGVRFRQYGDDCGDPNEMTILAVCKGKDTPESADNTNWEQHFLSISWSNG